MRVGVQMIFQSWGYDASVTDGDVVADEIRLGVLADELGFHALWPVEHHFNDYSFCPDNTGSSPTWRRSRNRSNSAPEP